MREDWEYEIIGKVCNTGAGGTPLKSKKEYYTGGDIPWLLSGEVGQPNILETKNFITKEGLNNSSAKLFPPNTVLVAMYGATAGETGILRIEASTNQAVCGIYPNSKFIPEFLYYCLLVKNKELVDQAQGNAQPNISQKKIKNLEIPIPPLPEQQRIVAILDEAFEAIDQAKANIERNIENAEELFQSKLNEIFSKRGKVWEEKPLGELTYVKSGGTPRRSTKEYWENGSIPWYSSGELNELFTNESKDLITEKGLKESNAKLFPKGSLLIGMYDTAALKMSILDRDGTFNQAISGVKPNDDLNLQFVMHAINAIKPELMKQRRGVRQKNLNLTKIKAIPIPFPKIEVQNEVVAHLSELHDYTNTLIDSYQNKLEDLGELKKSILQKAFSGELTANEHVAA